MDFELRAWVHVSASMDTRKFLFEILKQIEKLAREMKDMGIQEIRQMLFQKLAKTKRFLIVLDDVQPSDEPLLEELAMIIPIFSQGHMIHTTRDERIATYMNTSAEKRIRLKKLGIEESRKMLAWKLHRVPDDQRLSNEEKDILNMCRGLPLHISLLGGFMSNAGEHERAMLAEECSELDILQLSCHKLPVHLKPCFIYMALFPVAFPIPARRIVRLWLAEGLLDSHCCDRERKTTPEEVGETYILELADRNVIDVVSWRADGTPKACQMLTSLYDMIYPMAISMGFLHIHDTSKLKDRNDCDPTSRQQQLLYALRERTYIRWLAEHTNMVIDDYGGSYLDLKLGHVRSFLSFYSRKGMLTKDISTILRKMTFETDYSLLRVLDLEFVYKPSLQGVLHKLVLLRYLGLRNTLLASLPSAVADLDHLETLDIKHTNIISLPSSLWKARNLRHLHLHWFHIDLKNILKACRNNVNALTQLQTLSGLVIGEVKENMMRDHVHNLTTLTTLKLFLQRSGGDTSGAAGKAVADWISSRLTNLQSLTFGLIQEARPAKEAEPATSQIVLLPKLSLAEKHHDLLELYLLGQVKTPIWRELLPGSLRVLTLSGSKVEIDMMPELGGLLTNLRTFRLLAESFLGTCLRFTKDGFPSLTILKIWKLPRLEKVILEQGAMLHLKELEFRHLERLETVEGINKCKELENVSVISRSDALVDQLKGVIGEKTNLHVEKRTPRGPAAIYRTTADRYGTILNLKNVLYV
ncbi:disease resistance protein RPM1-like [Syzygium oleosum]|uniref:disease resistance protein RPM1-like n=1 Tax=Syzygium oleosum TaxID=219896 RepID=UPI0011D255C8|nr:disease resistance protein RPM1-like [Syzygium oleosum]